MSGSTGTVHVPPGALVATSDLVHESADVVGSLAAPLRVDVVVVPELAMLQRRLTGFEEARSRHDEQVFETFRMVAEFLAEIAVGVIAADGREFVSLPSAGW